MPKPSHGGVSPRTPLKNASELSTRLDLAEVPRLLLVDAPDALERLIAGERGAGRRPETIGAEAIRAVKGEFDAALVWREDRAGSHALLDRVVARLAPQATLWVVTAMRKVSGPRTPAVRRLELPDLVAAFSKAGLRHDREARMTAWHVGYRFVRGER
jgi:hypothetical protein